MEPTRNGCFHDPRALAWAREFREHGDLANLEQALDAVLQSPRPGPDHARIALVAAEVIAAMHGRPAPDFPSDLKHWVTAHNQAADPQRLRERAAATVDRILQSPDPDAAAPSGESAPGRIAHLRGLHTRLQQPGR